MKVTISFALAEEVLSSDNAIWLSKNGGRMVFATFDDRAVDVFDYPIYGETGSMQFQYTTSTAIRYPKVSGSTEFWLQMKYVL